MSDIKSVLPLAGANCINIIALGINIPLLSFYVVTLGGGEFEAIVIFAIFSAASFLTAPLWGRLSDNIGRKPAIIIALSITIISYIWLGLADSITEIFMSRILAGVSSGWMSIPLAYVGDVTSKENRAKGMGLIGAGFGIGFTIGPFLQAILVGSKDNPNFTLPIMTAVGFVTLGLLIIMFFVKEPKKHHANDRRISRGIFKDKNVTSLLAIYFCVFLVWTGFEGVFALWCLREFNLGPADVGMFLGFGGIITALVQGGLIGRLVKYYGEAKIVIIGVIILAVALMVLQQADEIWMIYAAMGMFGVAMGLHTPAMQSLFSRIAPEGRQGEVMGAAQSANSLARVIGPAWAGAVFVGYSHNMPYLMGAIFLIPILGAIYIVTNRLRAV